MSKVAEILKTAGIEPYYYDAKGDIAVVCGDCREILPGLPDGCFDLSITSPPYNLAGRPWEKLGHWKPGDGAGGRSKWRNGSDAGNGVQYGKHEDSMPWPEYVAWQQSTITELWRITNVRGAIFYNHKPRVIGAKLWVPLELVPAKAIVRQIITWARPGGMNFNGTAFVPTYEWIILIAKPSFRLKSKAVSGLGDVWKMTPDDNPHPAPFPIALPTKALEATDGMAVIDPFAGSGTTGRACKDLGRSCLMIELEERYCEISANRLRQEVLFT